MGKKKFATETEVITSADVGSAAVVAEATPKVERPTFHLVLGTAGPDGRTQYRFGKDKAMPKKAPEVDITLDGQPAKMKVTSSGGYSEVVGYNGWLFDKDGNSGWILFADGVNPSDAAQFPNGLHFTTTPGKAPANPLRAPKNAEGEANRRAAAKAAAEKRAAEKAAGTAEQAKVDAEQPAAA